MAVKLIVSLNYITRYLTNRLSNSNRKHEPSNFSKTPQLTLRKSAECKATSHLAIKSSLQAKQLQASSPLKCCLKSR